MDIRRRFLSKKSSGGSSGGDSSGTYTVNLNSQWEKTTAVTNPDSSLYDGVYRSTSNYNVHNTAAIMYIDISGLTSFKLYIRSYAESSYDYVMVSQLDQTINNNTSYSSTSLVKAHTRGYQQSGTALSSYTLVEFTGIDGGSHRITVVYRKDGSSSSGDDRGYVLIPKSQGSGGESGGGDVDIDATYSIMYTSSDENVVTPYATNVFGANITSNTYVNGQGIITFNGPVTSIGSNAFKDCTSMTSITIPDSVTSIGYYAFRSCTSMTSITIPDSVISIGSDAFGNCVGELIIDSNALGLYGGKFTKLTIGNSVTEIGGNAFNGCSSLASVTIGNSVTSIGRGAFDDCTSLTSVTIGNGVTSIGGSAFRDCTSLRSITIPDSVTSIEDCTFENCSGLTSVTIPDSVTSIGAWAFDGCTSLPVIGGIRYADTCLVTVIDKTLSSCNIRSGTRFIGNKAFSDCTKLTSITIPNSVISIGGGAFRDCPLTGNFTIWDNLQKIGSYVFNGSRFEKIFINSIHRWLSIISEGTPFIYSYYYTKGFYVNNVLLEHVVIPEDITIIPEGAFYGFRCIKSVTIPNSVTKIGNYVFTKCTGLTSITIPDSVTEIGVQAFNGCSSLESITLSSSLLTIGSFVFGECYKLKDVYCKSIIPPTGYANMFSIYQNGTNPGYVPMGCTIYVPTASVDAYKSATNWSEYADSIVGYDF